MYLKYLWYVLRHKWFVFVECWRLGIVWRGIVHDWHKLLPAEFVPYARFFYGKWPEEPAIYRQLPSYTGPTTRSVKADFDRAWLHHQKHPAGDHHWQYWLLQYDSGDRWTLQQMSIENPIVLVEDGTPLLWCEADPRFADDAIMTDTYRMCDRVARLLNQKPVALPMPDKARREMLADWRGAGRAITGKDNTPEWYRDNKDKMILHPDTREWIERALGIRNLTENITNAEF